MSYLTALSPKERRAISAKPQTWLKTKKIPKVRIAALPTVLDIWAAVYSEDGITPYMPELTGFPTVQPWDGSPCSLVKLRFSTQSKTIELLQTVNPNEGLVWFLMQL